MAEEQTKATGRIRWHDEEAGTRGRPSIRREASQGSLSIRSAHSRANSVDPATALPIQYRTV